MLLIVSSSGENNSPIAVVLARNVHFPMKPCEREREREKGGGGEEGEREGE